MREEAKHGYLHTRVFRSRYEVHTTANVGLYVGRNGTVRIGHLKLA